MIRSLFSAFHMRACELGNHSISLSCLTEGLGVPNLFEHARHLLQLLILIRSIPSLVYQTSLFTAMHFSIVNIVYPEIVSNINLKSKIDTRYSLSPKWLEHAGFSGKNQLLALLNSIKTSLRSSCS